MEPISDEVIMKLYGLSGLFSRMVREGIRESGRFPGEMFLLRVICESPGGRVTPSQASRAMHMRPPTLSPILGRLEEEGLLRRVPSQTDRRKIYLEVTEEGAAVYRQSREKLMVFCRKLARDLTPQELETFLALLKKVVKSYEPKALPKEVRPC